MSSKRTLIITICVAVIMGLYLGFVCFPKQWEIRKLSSKIGKLKREEKRLKNMDKELVRIKEELIKDRLEWKRNKGFFLTLQEAQDIKKKVKALRRAKKRFQSLKKENFYKKMEYKLELNGYYSYLLGVLSKMEYPEKLIIPSLVKVSFERNRWGKLILSQTLYISEE